MENDLISKSRVLEILDHAQIGAHDVDEFFQWASDIVEEEPTISPDGLRERGRWEKSRYDGFLWCSVCKNCYVYDHWPNNEKWKFCPSCGARMETDD